MEACNDKLTIKNRVKPAGKIAFLLLLSVSVLTVARSQSFKTVVIDAGHGGHDPGAIGCSNSFEKDVTLDMALRVGKLIKDNYPEIKVIYTRSTDVFVELSKRADIANKNHADLFLSIHCNSSPNATAYGSESFVMGVDKTNANMALVQKENSVILKESNYEDNYSGFDPYSPESYVIFSLLQNAYLSQSTHFASNIQKSFKNDLKRLDRGVKQAPFLVLWRTTMPSVLVELGFMSNKQEEAYLLSEKGKSELSHSIFKAMAEIIDEQNGSTHSPALDTIRVEEKVSVSDTNSHKQLSAGDSTKAEVRVIKPKAQVATVYHGVTYKVQFATVTEKKDPGDYAFRGLPQVECHANGKYYSYTAGNEFTYEAAQAVLKTVQEKGYKDAYIIAVQDGQRISLDKARALTK